MTHAKVKIPRAGDWTIGVHTDEGFALRFIGAPFESVSGGAERDADFPEFMVAPNNTTDSNARGVLKDLQPGTYDIEFISWERVGAAYYEIYAAEGAFTEDAETDQWQLIGAAGGLEIVTGLNLRVASITRQNTAITLDFTSPNPEGQHQIEQSSDLKSWQTVAGATFQKTGTGLRATLSGVTDSKNFYRVALP